LLAAVGQERSNVDWTTLRVPGGWKDDTDGRFAKYDGFAWYRCFIQVPDEWRGKELQVALFQLNNSIEVYFNGTKIGAAGVMPPDYRAAYNTSVRYAVPSELVKEQTPALVAVRMYDQGGRGGFKIAPALIQADQAIVLEGPWQFRTGDDRAWAAADGPAEPSVAMFSNVVDAAALAQQATSEVVPRSPNDALAALKVPDDLKIEQVLAEPIVRQPLQLSFDERGRMWVVQYIQYPDPAGLTVVSRDKFWRVVYDKVPPPPPNHFKGLDKITIHEDSDGDGAFDKHNTFVEGLNIATSVARGRGGVWVLNPPYLLFYPDRDNDDLPDGDPEVHLEGFGMEDTHSNTNSLCWGPDGWLYASQGSTVSGNIVRPGLDKQPVHSMGQLIWRYHPETRTYEIFAEGGGNAFGVEIDSKGRVYSGHNGGDTRGFHYVQGGYFQKGFGKHGPLSNPYTFGYFPAMKHHQVERFTHTFVIYEGGTLPQPYRGRLCGVAPIPSYVVMSEVECDGSSFKTKDLGKPVTSSDTWFRPVDIKVGPDGALYVADFYEGRIAHLNHHDGQIDKATGRVYRLSAADSRPIAPFDLEKLSTRELVDLLRHENKWFRHTALRLLGDRKDPSVVPLLAQMIHDNTGQLALDSLWALNLCGGFNEAIAAQTIEHADPHVRLWTVRLLADSAARSASEGDRKQLSSELVAKLAELTRRESSVEARSQLASSARRLPAENGLPIVRELLKHGEDTGDIHVPLLAWWAIESNAESNRDAVLELFEDSTLWQQPMVEQHIQERLMRRWAAAGSQADLASCAKLLRLAPGPEHVKRLLTGFETALAGRTLPSLPDELAEALAQFGGKSVILGLRQGRPDAVEEALKTVADEKADKAQQLQYIQIFGQVREASCVPVLLKIVAQSGDDALRGAALVALQKYDDPAIAAAVLASFARFTDDVRSAAYTLLASRAAWTLALLEAIDAGQIDHRSVPVEVAQKLALHGEPAGLPRRDERGQRIAALVAKLWGEIKSATPAELQQEIARLADLVRADSGSPWAGKKLFTNQCGKCHRLFDQGGQIGPDLTTYKRDDLENMLLHIVNPSVEIREGFETFLIATTDGRALAGFLVDQDPRLVVLRGSDGQNITLSRDEIEEMKAVPTSIMPEGQLKDYSAQQLRDLFAYLRSSQPLNE
jgi:putative heme-binding domain-containing protein